MTIALLATGDEIINGDTLNSNAHYLARSLSSEGLTVGRHMACSDKQEDIQECIQFLAKDHSILIITGGLGPTSDDRTRFALGQFMRTTLVEFPEAFEHVRNRLLKSNLALTGGNRQQAQFPPNAILLPNPQGTAMGCVCEWEGQLFFLLPGPPRECYPMFNDYVLPRLQSTEHENTRLLKWRAFGVAEGQIAQQMDDALQGIDCITGYRLDTPYVECKVRCKPELIMQINAIVEPILRPHLITQSDKKASEEFIKALAVPGAGIVISDQATGGHLQTLIQKPENWQRLQFTENPQAELQFQIEGLNEYWQEIPGTATSILTIHWRKGEERGSETHSLPYRSPLVVHLAAEWLCFRLLHLINQLHE
ncbi:competence damage inducible protein CinA [Legionella birminghamensis]|uniref:Competence damage inducible protein CinA n=1 Tax=Legionella birminghamensis TaxID=28083 RepID=A0A378ICT6_9GAMM|nr:competence/damage-inducible protein A [Legionella birminghamensis]KTC74511.1 competence damage inducible protein CinA [Legionella birminghamensis]STX32640.1 Competence damage inducible protein CinA [Legionella birminghamensis]